MAIQLFELYAAISADARPITNLASEVANLGKNSVLLAGNIEQTEKALEVFAGGAGAARKELALIDKTARSVTGLKLIDAEVGYQRLRALNFEAGTARDIIAGLGKQRILSGADTQSIDRVLVNFQQISADTSRFGADFKQIIHALPTMKNAFQSAFGTLDTGKLKKIFDENPQEAFKKLAKAMADTQGASGGLNSSLTDLENAWTQSQQAFGKSLVPEITYDIKALTGYIDENKNTFVSWGEYVTDVFRGARAEIERFNEEKVKPIEQQSAETKLVNFWSNVASQIWENSPFVNAITSPFNNLAEEGAKHRSERGGAVGQLSKYAVNKASLEKEKTVRKESLDALEADQKQGLSILENSYRVREALLGSHLVYTKEQELKNLEDQTEARRDYLKKEIDLQKYSFSRQLAAAEGDEKEVLKITSKRNDALGKLNADLALNEINTLKQSRQIRQQILEQNRNDLVSSKNLEIQSVTANMEQMEQNLRNKLSTGTGDISKTLTQLIGVYDDSYQQISEITKEQYEIQLKDERLTAQQKLNIQKKMFLDMQNLARTNTNAILKIQEEAIQRINDKQGIQLESANRFTIVQRQLKEATLSGLFGQGVSGAGIDAYIKSFEGIFAIPERIKKTSDDTNEALMNLSKDYWEFVNGMVFGRKTIDEALDGLSSLLGQRITNFEQAKKAFDEIVKAGSSTDSVLWESVELYKNTVEMLRPSVEKMRGFYKDLLSGGVTSASLDKLPLLQITESFNNELNDLDNRISEIKNANAALYTAGSAESLDYKKNQSEINELLRQRAILFVNFANASQEAYQNSATGLKEYLALLKNGDAFAVASQQLSAQKNVIGEQIGQYQQIANLKEHIKNFNDISSLEIEKTYLQDIVNLRYRETEAIIRLNSAQLELSQKWTFSQTQIKANIYETLAQTKGLTDIISSATTGAIGEFYGTIDSGVSALTASLGLADNAFGNFVNSMLSNLAKLAANQIFQSLFNPQAAQTSTGGGFLRSLLGIAINVGGAMLGGALTPSAGGGIGNFTRSGVPAPSASNMGLKFFASGALVPAQNGGHLAIVGEGGYDEYILSTDPKHKNRTAKLLSMFLNESDFHLPKFGKGGVSRDMPITPFSLPSIASSNVNNVSNSKSEQSINITVNINGGSNLNDRNSAYPKQTSAQAQKGVIAGLRRTGILG